VYEGRPLAEVEAIATTTADAEMATTATTARILARIPG
jgi:hypothetical protein